jgi:hypothetical protein
VKVLSQNFDELFGRIIGRWVFFLSGLNHMMPNMSLQDFHHQTIDGAAKGGQRMQDIAAILFLLHGAAQSLKLSLKATNAGEQSWLCFFGVGHRPRANTLGGYSILIKRKLHSELRTGSAIKPDEAVSVLHELLDQRIRALVETGPEDKDAKPVHAANHAERMALGMGGRDAFGAAFVG